MLGSEGTQDDIGEARGDGSPQLAEGFTAPARFRVVRRLGAGGMGVVYEVLDRERDLRVALKHLAVPGPSTLYLFKREFHALAGITHPNLVALYELISDGRQWFFTMELIDEAIDFMSHVRGERAAAVSKHAGPIVGPSTVTGHRGPPRVRLATAPSPAADAPGSDHGQLRAAFVQLATGVTALHRAGKLHRDLKPSNAMVRKDGRVVLVDFGLVVDIDAYAARDAAGPVTRPRRSPLVPLVTEGQIAGSIPYMAPEQAAGKPLSEASDWYAVGVMLFEALTGCLPFEGPPLAMWQGKQQRDAPAPSDLRRDIPADLDALCVALLRRDPAARPTGAQVLEQLAGASPETRVAGRPASAAPHEAHFVGRVAHLDKLRRAFDATAAGRAVMCRVVGKSGAGKTALVHRFIEETEERCEVTVLAGRCYEQESVPYKTIDNVVDALVNHLVRLPAPDVARLEPVHLPALCRVFPMFERVATWSTVRDRVPQGRDPRELRGLAFAALRQLLVAVSAQRRLVIYIDDVQWGDVDGATLLAGLLEPRDGLHVLLVLTYRSEDQRTSSCLAALAALSATRSASRADQTVVVDPLTAAETEELALGLIGRDTPDAMLRAAWVVRESDGNALFIHELAQHLDAGSSAASTEGTSLDDVLWQRVCRLPDDTRRLLEVIAVAGQPIRLRAAQDAAGVPSLPPEAVTALRAGKLVRGTGPGLDDEVQTFHDRIRETVVAHLPPATRAAHHRRLAAALEATGGAAPETIAAHCYGAGDRGKASDYYVAAADLAVRALAFERAEVYYRHAAEFARTDAARAAVWEKMIHYYTNMARFADAYAVGRAAARQFGVALPARFMWPWLILDLIRLSFRMRGREPWDLLGLPTVSDPRIEAAVRLLCTVLKAAYQLRPVLSAAISTRVVNLCLRYGNTRDCAVGYMVFGAAAARWMIFQGGARGRHRLNHEFGRLALGLVEKYNNADRLAEVAVVVGYFGTPWQLPAIHAEALWRTAYEAGQRTGDLFSLHCACVCTVASLVMRGAPLAAVHAESLRHVALLERYGLRESLAVLQTVQRTSEVLRGPTGDEVPGAGARADAADEAELERRLTELSSKHCIHFHYVLQTQLRYLQGDLERAAVAARRSADYFDETLGILHRADHEVWSALVAAARCRDLGWFRTAALVRAVKRSQRRLAGWAAGCPDNFRSKERVVAGELARLRGDRAGALACFAAAAEAAERAGHLHIAGLAHELAARLQRAAGRADAVHHVQEATRYYQQWGATALIAGLEARIAAHA